MTVEGGKKLVRHGNGQTTAAAEPSCGDGHSERSEESQCLMLVGIISLNTDEQEGGRGITATQYRAVIFLHFTSDRRNDMGASEV